MMNEFKSDVIKINNNTVIKVKKEYLNLIKKYRKQFINVLSTSITNYVGGIPIEEVEEWVDTYLITYIKAYGIKKIEEIGKILGCCLDKDSNINNYQDYVKFIDNILNSNNKKSIWLHNIASDFQSDFIREVRNYYNSNKEKIEVRDFEKSLLIIRSDLRNVLRRSCDHFLNEYKSILKRELLYNVSLMKDKFLELEDNNKGVNDKFLDDVYKKFYSIVNMFGYLLVIRDNKIFIIDKNNVEIEMVYDDNLLREKDKFMIEFSINSNNSVVMYADNSKNVIVRCTEDRIEILLDKSRIISILKIRDGVSYFLNDELVDTLSDIDEKVFMNKLPFFYQLVVSWKKNNVLIKKR